VRRYLYIAALVIAGEMVFGLPFSTERFFRSTMLEVFGFSNTQLGDLFAIYGVAAMISYFPGGAIADRFTARFLLTTSMIATAAGGLYMATIPGPTQMGLLYGFWGITTILLFWGALIRATREWGGQSAQGAAFGILESGRGIVGALAASLLVAVFSLYMPDDAALVTDASRRSGFQMVILGYSAIAFLGGVLAWFVIPVPSDTEAVARSPLDKILLVLKRPATWAHAAIIICAYCGYKSISYFPQYAVEVLGLSELEGAQLASYGAYIRPVAALSVGLIADRFTASRSIIAVFAVMAVSLALLSLSAVAATSLFLIYSNIAISAFAIFALRGVYFALLEETETPRFATGTAVGIISVVGFTPDIFFAPIVGRILDAAPGPVGFLNLFMLLAGIAVLGLVSAVVLLRLQRNKMADRQVSIHT